MQTERQTYACYATCLRAEDIVPESIMVPDEQKTTTPAAELLDQSLGIGAISIAWSNAQMPTIIARSHMVNTKGTSQRRGRIEFAAKRIQTEDIDNYEG